MIKQNQIKGKIEAHRDGFAFFIPEDNTLEDLFIHPKNLNGATHSDVVYIRVNTHAGRKEAIVTEIIERGIKKVIGIADIYHKKVSVIPFSQNFTHMINVKNNVGGVREGSVVICRIDKYPSGRANALGSIEEVIGHITDVGIDNKIVMHKYGLLKTFNKEAQELAKKIEKGEFENKYKKITDFKNLFTVTIDGETARDFDDAISVEIEKDKFVLYVHIADVSRFVERNSPIDNEAKSRGTSVYFPEFAIPMLPEELSSGVCSLLPNVERFCVTAKITFSNKGDKLASEFFRSVIKSDFRLTYKYVNDVLDKKEKYKSEDLKKFLDKACKLAEILEDRRKREGGIDFDLKEADFVFGKDGRVADIFPAQHGFSERLIEYFMISANEAVAEFLFENKVDTVYRIHEEPDNKKLLEWVELARGLGLQIPKIEYPVSPEGLKELSKISSNSKYSDLLNSLLVRAMSRAVYSVENHGHYGLASLAYTHFTSPIRRYPDLLVHRALLNKLKLGEASETKKELVELAAITSKQERKADEAESEIGIFKKLEYLEINEDKIFDAYINRITQNGLSIYIEKLMMTSFINYENITFDIFSLEHKYAVGEVTQTKYKIGDRIKVKLYSLDISQLKTTFELIKT